MNESKVLTNNTNIELTLPKRINKRLYLIIKRLFDIICALIGCIFLIPLIIIVKLCYLLTGDTKSIFYKQKRIGKDVKLIYIFKFS